MKILGCFKNNLFYLRILVILSGLSIGLQTYKLINNTSDVNTLSRNEKPRGGGRRVTSESNWKKYYGSCPELTTDIKTIGKELFKRELLSVHPTVGKTNYEETRQLFLNDVLTSKLDDGSPAYYNSNILGRYYRKDYFN